MCVAACASEIGARERSPKQQVQFVAQEDTEKLLGDQSKDLMASLSFRSCYFLVVLTFSCGIEGVPMSLVPYLIVLLRPGSGFFSVTVKYFRVIETFSIENQNS